MAVSGDEIARSIEPGSLEYGDRQVVEDRIRQVAMPQQAPPTPQGQTIGRSRDRMGAGPVSDLPVTDGLSVGPGAGPRRNTVMESAKVQQLRTVAQNARNPMIKKLALDGLRAIVERERSGS